jgi:hypothetical protein
MDIRKAMEKCELCNKKGKIEHVDALFCSEEHVKLFDRKWKDAEKRMNAITTCSTCGKRVGKNVKLLTDCRIKNLTGDFTPHKFCNNRCFESWEL